jgi:hypothetical protein
MHFTSVSNNTEVILVHIKVRLYFQNDVTLSKCDCIMYVIVMSKHKFNYSKIMIKYKIQLCQLLFLLFTKTINSEVGDFHTTPKK